MERYNVEWKRESENSSESMPVGGGDIGCNVWVEKHQIYMYLAQSGWFDENNSLLKGGRVRINIEPCPFINEFSQQLIMEKGQIKITGEGCTVLIWTDGENRVVHLELESTFPRKMSVSYESWREKDRIIECDSYELFQCKEVFFYPLKEIRFHRDQIIPEEDTIVFYHQNDNSDLSAEKEFNDQGIGHLYENAYNPQKDSIFGGVLFCEDCEFSAIENGKYLDTEFVGYIYESRKPVCRKTLSIALLQKYTDNVSKWEKEAKAKLSKSRDNLEKQKLDAQEWWKNFWSKSYIHIESKDEILNQAGRNYQLFRFMLGCGYSSFWPIKFNGGLFTFDPGLVGKSEWTEETLSYTPDYRLWGGGSHTIQNQRLLYWPLLRSGDFEMMPQHFEFFNRTLDTAKKRVRHHFGISGAAYAEQVGTYGLCCGCDQEWGNQSGLPCTQIRYHFSNSLETILMILEYHSYTGKSIAGYLELINSILRFYYEFYPEKDEKGKMIIYPANALETYHVVKNPVDAIAGLSCVLEELLLLEENGITEEMRSFWKELLKCVPELPKRIKNGHEILSYAETKSWVHNCEIPELYTVFPYKRFGLLKSDENEMRLAVDTARHAPETEEQKSYVSWHPTGIAYARLGMKEEAVEFLKKKLQNGPFRFPAFWGPGHDWVPDHNWGGSGMIQLQEMLVQSEENQIILFPCWPEEANVSFRLYAHGKTCVECEYKNGKIIKLQVTPKEHMSWIRIGNEKMNMKEEGFLP